MSHDYLSTACYHEGLAGGDPGLHAACRRTCKFCDASCSCPRHSPGEPAAQVAASWVGQARGIARELLALLEEADAVPYKLHEQLGEDPALFWLRGEEKPPGEWKGPGGG